MNWHPISDEVRNFIISNIPSIPYLEALLIFKNEREELGINYIADRLFISPDKATQIILQLENAGIITIHDKTKMTYVYAPKFGELEEMLELLAETYAMNLVEVTNIIHSNANKKAQAFANAFIWKKEH